MGRSGECTFGRSVCRSVGWLGYTIFHVITDIKCQKIFALSVAPCCPAQPPWFLPPSLCCRRSLTLFFPLRHSFNPYLLFLSFLFLFLTPSFSTIFLSFCFSLLISPRRAVPPFLTRSRLFSLPRSRKFSIPFM